MINQNNVEKVKNDFWMDWETAARLRTVVKGQTMPPITFKGRKTRKATRKMSIGYYVSQLVEKSVVGVKPDAESIQWMAAGRKAAIKKREEQDERVRNGVNRKPKSEWKKPGRVAGKVYPKYVAAMKRLAAGKKKKNQTK